MGSQSIFWLYVCLVISTGLSACGTEPTDGDADADSDADGDMDASEDGAPDGDSDLLHIDEEPGCENLNPLYCAFPFPSDRYLLPDDETDTGYRIFFPPGAMPDRIDPDTFDFTPFHRLDGMSPATQIMTLFSRPADLADAAGYDSIERSLEEDSPTAIIDLESGERVAHWTENDLQAQSEEETVLYLRLAGVLEENHAYAVALRELTDDSGAPLEPSAAFVALRDGLPTDSNEIEARREGFEQMFAALEEAGFDRSELQAAWRFHTASGRSIRGDLMHARADALERLGPEGIGCTVTAVDEGYGDDGLTLRRIQGTFTVPSYMESPLPPTRYSRGSDDMPQYVEDVEVTFTAIIPTSLVEGPEGPRSGFLITYGHGLLGNANDTLSNVAFRRIAHETEAVMIGTDWAGMSSSDVMAIGEAFMDPSLFVNITERLQQGMINQIALTRTFAGACSDIEEFQHESGVNLVDTSELYYVGGSQGGIYGGTLLTISPDIHRGVLLVNGVVFPFMMERSIDYVPYLPIFDMAFPNRLDRVLLLPLAQLLWDAAEPAGYLQHMGEGLPGIGPKQVLSIAAENDAQVPNLSTDQAMRMVGVPVIEGSTREPFGFDVVSPPHTGSGYITIDMGDPPVPEGNTAPSEDAGGHFTVGQTELALQVVMSFLFTGEIILPCDGVCDPD